MAPALVRVTVLIVSEFDKVVETNSVPAKMTFEPYILLKLFAVMQRSRVYRK